MAGSEEDMNVSITRREFVGFCGAGMAAVALGPLSGVAVASVRRRDWGVEELTRGLFEGHVCETFLVKSEEAGPVPLRLAAADALTPMRSAPKGVPKLDGFSLLFESEDGAPLGQGMYSFENVAMGSFALFMTPVVSCRPGVRCYEIIINRLVSE
jgi:hypothetical protein